MSIQRGGGGSRYEEVQFKPFESNAFEIGLCKGDFSVICPKCPGAIGKVQFALNQEGPEFVRVDTVKLIRFTDFGLEDRGEGGMTSGMDEVLDGACELHHRILRDLLIHKVWVIILGV